MKAELQRLSVERQDRIPPSLSDGTWDAEGTLIAALQLMPEGAQALLKPHTRASLISAPVVALVRPGNQPSS